MAGGILKYSVVESNNLALGQAGFDVLADNSTTAASDEWTGGTHWVAIKALGGDVAIGAATVTGQGDDVAGTLTISDGDILYGVFTTIHVNAANAGDCIAYRG